MTNSRSASNQTVTVAILGKDYQVSCGQDEVDDLVRAARQLDQRMRAIRQNGNVIGLERIAVMAALNLSHELLQAEQQNALSEKLIERVAGKLDQTLLNPGS
ncbi:cell division protein ZapA [Halioxenophilus sp. WMMB6]|uniref:cell division protein ZapA n=1 Tax=Halioxenophilus sp. WMMB6 TaxID=3073815 RepID=UPI00295E473F|nr:cell division protein ZapA [Halioxenophilus sp. WMMB6]